MQVLRFRSLTALGISARGLDAALAPQVCKICPVAATISFVTANAPTSLPDPPFQPGAIVVVTLCNPREKFWGSILALKAEGLSITGVELTSFDGFIQMLKADEPCSPGVLFFPMHRLERVELDLPEGGVPSLSQRLASKTGLDVKALFAGERRS